jgi:hypothetical protein
MTRDDIYELEKQLIFLLNLDGWQIKWSEDKYCHYDAIGTDINGNECILEFKFRRAYYKTKIMECKKWNNLTHYKSDKKYYCVIDQKGCFVYDIGDIDHQSVIELPLPKETITEKIVKEKRFVYELKRPPKYFYQYNFF